MAYDVMAWDGIGRDLLGWDWIGSDRTGPEFRYGITLRGNFDVINVNVYGVHADSTLSFSIEDFVFQRFPLIFSSKLSVFTLLCLFLYTLSFLIFLLLIISLLLPLFLNSLDLSISLHSFSFHSFPTNCFFFFFFSSPSSLNHSLSYPSLSFLSFRLIKSSSHLFFNF